MKENYRDIVSRISEEPKWYDENGVPRYDKFHPSFCPDIYSDTVILLRIACQSCGKQFDVEMHSSFFAPIKHPQNLHYGDPPNHGCIGDSMNCDDIAVLEVWHREEGWIRIKELEGVIDQENNI